MHGLSCEGMSEVDGFGMQVETAGRPVAIERVSQYGGIQTLPVGTVYTQLVGSSCVWEECQLDGVFLLFHNLILRDGLLAMTETYFLSGTV